MDRDHELIHALRLLTDGDLAALSQSASWTMAAMESGKHTRLARWSMAMMAVFDDEGRRRQGSSNGTVDANRQLRLAAQALTERELFLLSMEYQITLVDVEAHWGRSYIPFVTTLRQILRHQLSQRHDAL